MPAAVDAVVQISGNSIWFENDWSKMTSALDDHGLKDGIKIVANGEKAIWVEMLSAFYACRFEYRQILLSVLTTFFE